MGAFRQAANQIASTTVVVFHDEQAHGPSTWINGFLQSGEAGFATYLIASVLPMGWLPEEDGGRKSPGFWSSKTTRRPQTRSVPRWVTTGSPWTVPARGGKAC